MSKAGNILLLVMAFFSITGAMHETKATKKITQDLSSCSASRVSTKLCEEILNQSCIASPEETLKQAQGNVIVAGSQSQTLQASSAIDPIVLPTMQPLAPESLQNDTPLNSDLIFDLANQFRASVGLAPFEKDDSFIFTNPIGKIIELPLIPEEELWNSPYIFYGPSFLFFYQQEFFLFLLYKIQI